MKVSLFKILMAKKTILIIAVIILVALFGVMYFIIPKYIPKDSEQVFCTQDAMQCPDGSYVGRTDPNCEFAVCPGFATSRKTYFDSNNIFSFTYPTYFGTEFAEFKKEPLGFVSPQGSVRIDASGCYFPEKFIIMSKSSSSIGEKVFCITALDEHHSERIYRTYWYTTQRDAAFITLEFVVNLSNNCNEHAQTSKFNECAIFMESYEEIVVKSLESSVATLQLK
jgi:hypothetical protein